ncbi:MAG: HNH endonuclease [Gemmatimonadaceae bacterium]|nr:HNH endonuclease [Gemmatimonadaceae bacterium]
MPITSDKYTVNSITQCWEWAGSRAVNGYGHFQHKGKTKSAHRALYEQLVGPIPDGHHLHHLCENRLCINPDHLEPVPKEDHKRKFHNKDQQVLH